MSNIRVTNTSAHLMFGPATASAISDVILIKCGRASAPEQRGKVLIYGKKRLWVSPEEALEIAEALARFANEAAQHEIVD